MGFEESVLARMRRYREEADRSLTVQREVEETARRFSERLFAGLERTAALGWEAGFRIEIEREYGAESRATFGLLKGVAAETDEDLMHEELSRYNLDPSGYSGRILGWSEEAGEEPCQTFAIYGDGVWKTKGLFVAKARGWVDDSDEVLGGRCLRTLGRLVDLAALTGGVGRRWAREPYTLTNSSRA